MPDVHVPTIAILIDHLDYLDGGYSSLIRAGVERAAALRGVNLQFFLGRELGIEPECRVYDLAVRPNVDGVILVSATLAAHAGVQAVVDLVGRLDNLPVCSLGVELPHVASVVADNRPGLSELIDHLIVAHGRTRLAFLRGHEHNPDAQARFSAYLDVLKLHRIPVDETLILSDVCEPSSGRRAVEELIARRVAFDAVVAVNDAAAIGAYEALTRAGFRIPKDVSVTGFDDLAICRFMRPPLSTVRQPIAQMAAKALEVVLEQIAGSQTGELHRLPAESVIRTSCGCSSAWAARSLYPCEPRNVDTHQWFEENHARLRAKLGDPARGELGVDNEWLDELLAEFEREIGGETGAFTAFVECRFLASDDRARTYDELQAALATLREELGAAGIPMDGLWALAQQALAAANMADQARQRTELEVAYVSLLRSGERLTASIDLPSLRAVLADELPRQHDLAFVSLLDTDNDARLEPFFCMSGGELHSADPGSFSARALVPPGVPLLERRKPWLVMPLTAESAFMGVVVLEMKSDVNTHEMIRSQISSALRNVSLHRRIVQETAEHERATQERSATAKRMQSLSLLAGGVAHDLNNALGPLVALPDMIVDRIREISCNSSEGMLIEDLATIKGSAQRAAITIKDLLTMGRQGRMAREPLDLNRLVTKCLEFDAFLHERAKARGIQLRQDLQFEQLVVLAAEMQLQRAVLNLVSNAIDASPEGGTVTVRTRSKVLTDPMHAYETIPIGSYAMVEIIDAGCGIDAADLARIFEPFFTRKRLSESSGSGLGLSIVHGVVKEHEGFANVESQLGLGTTFSLYLPRQVQRLVSDAPQSMIRRGTGRILVVDDDPIQLRTSRRILLHFGYEVVTVSTPEQALATFAESNSDSATSIALVMADMQLGGNTDGLQLLRQIHRIAPRQRAMLVSGHAPSERLTVAIRGGVTFLPKPYTREELMRAITRTMEAPPPEPKALEIDADCEGAGQCA